MVRGGKKRMDLMVPSWDLREGSMALRDLRTLDRRTRFCLNISSRLLVVVLIVTAEHGEALARPRSGFLVNAKWCVGEGEGGKNEGGGRIISNSLTLCLSPLLHIIILHCNLFYFYLCIDKILSSAVLATSGMTRSDFMSILRSI